jgi:hypothetical protein
VSDVGRLERAAAWLAKVQCYSPSFDNVKSLVAFVDQETNSSALAWSLNERLSELAQENERLKEAYDLLTQDYAGVAADRKGLALENEALKTAPPVALLQVHSFADINAALAKITKREPISVRFDGHEWMIGEGNQNSATSIVCCVLDYFLPKGPTA